jgi:transposase
MDNLRVHHSRDTKVELDKMKYFVKFLPTYSCCLNPIERCWSLIKRKWYKLNIDPELENTSVRGLLFKVISDINNEKFHKNVVGVERIWLSVLKGELA